MTTTFSVKIDIKYCLTRKEDGKEAGQQFVKQELQLNDVTERQFADMVDYVESITGITELIPT